MDPESIQDLFQELGPVRVRRMFGGHGIYAGDQIFGIEIGGEIYLKADGATRPAFEAAGSRPFTYEKGEGRSVVMSYWLMPSEAADDPSEAARWARLALDAGRRAATAKTSRKRGR
ncbi:MAG TPA: TfoX/Sxy family protein [Microvirga sp.]|nr:TfoX/Sxy family protein [Microvirga sp.]